MHFLCKWEFYWGYTSGCNSLSIYLIISYSLAFVMNNILSSYVDPTKYTVGGSNAQIDLDTKKNKNNNKKKKKTTTKKKKKKKR